MESPYERLGRDEGVRAIIARFYGFMDTLPEAATIRVMHAADLEPMIDKLATFLIGWLGGPQRYGERFGRIIIPIAHRPYAIGPAERDAWLLCMRRALEESGVETVLVRRLMEAFHAMADMCRTERLD